MSLVEAASGVLGKGVAGITSAATTPIIKNIARPFTEGIKDGISPVLDAFGDVIEEGAELNPVEQIQSKLLKERTPEQQAAQAYNDYGGAGGKAYVRPVRVSGDKEFWDLLYDEPCWVDPDSGTFDLATAFGKLWKQWYNVKSPRDKVKELAGTGSSSILDIEKLRTSYYENLLTDGAKPSHDNKRTFEKAVKRYLGTNVDPDTAQVGSSGSAGGEADETQDITDKGKINALLSTLDIPLNVADDFIKSHDNLGEALLSGGWLNAISSAVAGQSGSGDPGPKVEIDRDWSKFAFCFFIKFLMGPVGYMILKIMPYFMRFIWTIVDSFQRIRYMIMAGAPWAPGKPFFYTSKNGKPRVKMIKTHHTLYSYFGLVLPLGLIKYDWGQVYGNGHFGKFILSLTILSAGLIIMGGISVFVFIIVFGVYCAKTLSMFGDNIDEKKKK